MTTPRETTIPDEKEIGQSAAEVTDAANLNASGHVQEVDRNFNLLSIISIGCTAGSFWPPLGGSIATAIYNGGPPGVIWEFVVVAAVYWVISACIAELASSVPSSAGVYHWATLGAGPRWGKLVGFITGWWNFLGWILGVVSVASIAANILVSMWALFHDDYVFQRWHAFLAYLIVAWMACSIVAFAHRALPAISTAALFLLVGSGIATVLVCVIRPHNIGSGYSSNSFVWIDWVNLSGYSNGFAFVAGMLNGGYAVGVPDVTTHLAEEIPRPETNIPKAILAQNVIGFLTAFPYIVALFYGIGNNIDPVFNSTVPFPLAALYRQAAGSKAGSLGLLIIILLPILNILVGVYVTAGRILWTLARDDATPFSKFLGRIHHRRRNQFNATIACGCICTVYGAIYVGSLTAFNAFVGSALIFFSISYAAAILPNLINRDIYIKPGPFNMGRLWGRLAAAFSCAYIVTFAVIFCFPYYLPTNAQTMNYSSVITGGSTILVCLWYLWKRKSGYKGPSVLPDRVH